MRGIEAWYLTDGTFSRRVVSVLWRIDLLADPSHWLVTDIPAPGKAIVIFGSMCTAKGSTPAYVAMFRLSSESLHENFRNQASRLLTHLSQVYNIEMMFTKWQRCDEIVHNQAQTTEWSFDTPPKSLHIVQASAERTPGMCCTPKYYWDDLSFHSGDALPIPSLRCTPLQTITSLRLGCVGQSAEIDVDCLSIK